MGRRAPGSPRSRSRAGAGLKVRLASIGKDRSGLFAPGVAEYAGRLAHYTRFELVELPEAKGSKLKAESSKAREEKQLLGLVSSRDWLVALDERGKQHSSLELAAWVGKAQGAGRDLLFVIGGDEGLAPGVLARAELTLSLSRMTLPHRLARLVLVEQLYRAFTVLKGEPYHK